MIALRCDAGSGDPEDEILRFYFNGNAHMNDCKDRGCDHEAVHSENARSVPSGFANYSLWH